MKILYKYVGAVVNNEAFAVNKIFTYKIPERLQSKLKIGHRIKVPFGRGNKKIDAFVAKDVQINPDRKEGVTKWATFIGNGPPRFEFGNPGGGGTPQAIYMMFETTTHEDIFRWIKKIEEY